MPHWNQDMSPLSLRKHVDCLFLITTVSVGLLLSGLLATGPLTALSPVEALFVTLAACCYSLIYLIPAWLITHAIRWFCERRTPTARRTVLTTTVIAWPWDVTDSS